MSRKAWMLSRILQKLKSTPEKLAVAVNTGGHSIHMIQILTERSASDGGNLCPLRLVILKSV